MSHLDWTIKAAVMAVVVVGILKGLPAIMAVTNPRRLRCWFADALARDEVLSRSPASQARLRELEALGFFMLGVKHEKLPLWGRRGWEIATASQKADTFASIVLTEKAEPFIVYFYTPFREGGFIYTRQQSTLLQLEGHNISVKNIASNNLDDLFRSHCERTETFKQKWLHPTMVSSQEARIEATYSFYSSNYAKKIMASSVLITFLPSLLVACLLLFVYRK